MSRFGFAALAAIALTTSAGATYQSSPERRTLPDDRHWDPILVRFHDSLIPSLMQDFGERYIYAAADAALPPPARDEHRVVFFGDSITDRWDLAKSFPGKPYVNRGIGSQVTSQMILRFHQDVVALKPSAVVILAGINDIQGFLQRETPEQIESNYEALADLADAHGIRVVFGSVLPVNDYTPAGRNNIKERNPAEIRALNVWLKAFCARRGYGYADYYDALVDSAGEMRSGYSEDGVHPLDNGYALMAPVAARAIEDALKAHHAHDKKGE
jgi:lysophospholipase L1-like esterase